ncbi:transcriptional regulator [Hahella sp. CCB-MM4]|uniref:FmdB family zinc ribbon protein n=1 Tax=Hahella sp. (strain CCB-MM4) TaxID=1926491 RepID=UPI000B9BAAE2|nr:FmdB family zinc ribbon protein [Hahella sp. CCB-MM4]OZG72103.1 transcriptional regulator [Hahella sp. CCB-MM4]
MPIYEYVCNACGFEKDVLQSMSEAPLTDCPSCEKPEFTKKISAPGFRLKGSGWYETDFKTGKKKNLAGDAGGASSGAKAAEAN